MDWHWDNTFVRELGWLGVRIDPAPVAEPTLLALDDDARTRLRSLSEALRDRPGAVRAFEAIGSQVTAG